MPSQGRFLVQMSADTQLSAKEEGTEGYTSQLDPALREDASQFSSMLKEDALQSHPALKDSIVSRNTAPNVESCIRLRA